jgi:hypothetical protein
MLFAAWNAECGNDRIPSFVDARRNVPHIPTLAQTASLATDDFSQRNNRTITNR